MIDWLCDTLEFELRLKVEGDDGQIVHSAIPYSESVVIVSGQSMGPGAKFSVNPHRLNTAGGNTQCIMLITDDAVENDARVRLYRLYRLEQAQFALLRDWFAEVEAFWADQLHAFKKHAEATRQSPRKLKPRLILKAKQRVPER